MSTYTVNNAGDAVDLMRSFLEEFANEEKRKTERAVTRALKRVDRDIAKYQRDEIQRVYKETIKRFYDEYTPNIYQRTGSLYNLMSVTEDTETNIVAWDYDEKKMTPTRKNKAGGREYLMDIVFGEGWHGGADKGPGHRNPGVPYYRQPPPYYRHWDRYPAARYPGSPYQIAEEAIRKLDEPGGPFWVEFERLANQYIAEELSKT